MRIFAAILFSVLATLPAISADPGQIFSTILGELGRQIERDHQRQQAQRLRPLWNACARGEVAACDRAARFPNLNNKGRAEIRRMREAAQLRPAYERNFYACQKMERAACQAALAYPYMSDTDRVNLQRWKRQAAQRHDALAAFSRNQRDCYAGSIPACTSAIGQRHLNESAIPGLERQLAQLREAERERLARERDRQAALAMLRLTKRKCYGGSIAACTAAITNAEIDARGRRDLEHQRARLQSAQRQRDARERQRQAAIQEYVGLRNDCADGNRAACTRAAAHPHVRAADIASLEQRARELAPLTERVATLFVASGSDSPDDPGSDAVIILFSALALIGAVIGAVYVGRNVTPRASFSAKPASPEAPSDQPVNQPTTAVHFPLTGHMPTDVRHVLLNANP